MSSLLFDTIGKRGRRGYSSSGDDRSSSGDFALSTVLFRTLELLHSVNSFPVGEVSWW